jgi:hypothetical protein
VTPSRVSWGGKHMHAHASISGPFPLGGRVLVVCHGRIESLRLKASACPEGAWVGSLGRKPQVVWRKGFSPEGATVVDTHRRPFGALDSIGCPNLGLSPQATDPSPFGAEWEPRKFRPYRGYLSACSGIALKRRQLWHRNFTNCAPDRGSGSRGVESAIEVTAMSLRLWRPLSQRLCARVRGECVPSCTCGTMVETKSLVGDLDAGRKLTREAFGRRDTRLTRCLRTSQGAWCGPLLRMIPHRAALTASPAVLFNPRLSEILPRPVADSGTLAWEDPG